MTETTVIRIVAVCTKCLGGVLEGTPYVGTRHVCGGRIRSLVEPVPLEEFAEFEVDDKLDLKLRRE